MPISATDLNKAYLAYFGRPADLTGKKLGAPVFVRGQLPEALAAMRAADAIDVDLDRSTARLDRARVLLEAGLVAEARSLLADIAPADPHLGGERDLELARALLLLGYAGALRRRRATGRGSPSPSARRAPCGSAGRRRSRRVRRYR
mgnify:CR=1 FL=1